MRRKGKNQKEKDWKEYTSEINEIVGTTENSLDVYAAHYMRIRDVDFLKQLYQRLEDDEIEKFLNRQIGNLEEDYETYDEFIGRDTIEWYGEIDEVEAISQGYLKTDPEFGHITCGLWYARKFKELKEVKGKIESLVDFSTNWKTRKSRLKLQDDYFGFGYQSDLVSLRKPLNQLRKELIREGFIQRIETSKFENIFDHAKRIHKGERINWLKDLSSLKYFINKLRKEKVISTPHQKHWEISIGLFHLGNKDIPRDSLRFSKAKTISRSRKFLDFLIEDLSTHLPKEE